MLSSTCIADMLSKISVNSTVLVYADLRISNLAERSECGRLQLQTIGAIVSNVQSISEQCASRNILVETSIVYMYLGAWDHMGTVQIQGHIMTSTCEEMGALQMGHVLGLDKRRKQLLHT
jgi:hypothetical protein